MRFIAVKSVNQQARLCWHRVREGYKVESLAIGSRLRGLRAEFGIAVAKGEPALRAVLADLDRETELPAELKGLIGDLNDHWQRIRDRIGACDARIEAQHSSGGHARLGTIRCRGDAYLPPLLIQGARSSVQRANAVSVEKATPEQRWIAELACRTSFGKLLVAIANKHARQLWALLAHGVDYDPNAAMACSMAKRSATPHTATHA